MKSRKIGLFAVVSLLVAQLSFGQSSSESSSDSDAEAESSSTGHSPVHTEGHSEGQSMDHSMKRSGDNTAHGSQEYRIGDLVVSQPHSRATPPGATVAGGYLTITNHGKTDDVLIGGEADFAAKTEIHSMKMENDVMKMRRMKDGLAIPAGETVALAHGGYHLMFKELKEPLGMDQSKQLTLVFKEAGELDIELKVVPLM